MGTQSVRSTQQPTGRPSRSFALGIVVACVGILACLSFASSASATQLKDISAGVEFSCGISDEGAAMCWGQNGWGRLGDGTEDDSALPVHVTGLSSGVTAISAGNGHACAVVSGAAKCWGNNADGQLGDGSSDDSSTPVDVAGLGSGEVTAIAVGAGHTCAVVSGAAKCWGDNWYGQLGDGNSVSNSATPVDVIGLGSGVTAISASESYSCAIVNSGAKCWGHNNYGQLGDDNEDDSPVPVEVFGLDSDVTAISSGEAHSCAIVSDVVKCWGVNNYGELGDGSEDHSSRPVDVTGLGSDVIAITAGRNHSCAISDGGAKCWGSNENGRLGNDSVDDSNVPVDVTGLSSGSAVTAVSAGYNHTCAIAGGVAKCWGDNLQGQLGNGVPLGSLAPVAVVGLGAGVSAISASGYHACAVVGGAARCWGEGYHGELGNNAGSPSPTPVDVFGLGSGVTAISAGESYTCAVVSGGAKCWGNNANGRMGDGTHMPSMVPVEVSGLGAGTGVSAVATANLHACAIVNGSAKCWGTNDYGGLGDGTGVTPNPITPVNVQGLGSGVTAISAGWGHSCAIVNGGAKCWGSNGQGELGNGTKDEALAPVGVIGLDSGVTAISSTGRYNCAIVSDVVKCWGLNTLTPVEVTGLGSGVTAVSTSGWHSCAVVSGAAKCWGDNWDGQLGDGTSENDSSTPVDVIGLGSGVTAIAAGGDYTCAVVDDAAKCWGYNYYGTLGDGNSGSAMTPRDVLVPDITRPVISGVPADIKAVATSPSGAVVTYASPTAVDDVDGPLAVACSPVSGSTFAITTTTVSCSAQDAAGNSSSASFNVTVGAIPPPAAAAPAAPAKPKIVKAPKSVKLGKSIKVRTSCAIGCKLKLTLKIGKKKIKLRAVSAKPGTKTVRIKLPKSAIKKIKAARKKNKKVKVTLTLAPTSKAGNGKLKRVTIK